MAETMKNGFVYGIDNIKDLTEDSIKNIKKNHSSLLDNGNLIMSTGKGLEGCEEHGPYDCIHVGIF
jgi:protein-L-isoaspartate O-methyltransferase